MQQIVEGTTNAISDSNPKKLTHEEFVHTVHKFVFRKGGADIYEEQINLIRAEVYCIGIILAFVMICSALYFFSTLSFTYFDMQAYILFALTVGLGILFYIMVSAIAWIRKKLIGRQRELFQANSKR